MLENIIVQEFYCNDCKGDGAYFRVRMHAGWDRNVVVVCPKCGRKHPRKIVKGVISEIYYNSNDGYDEIHVPLSAWSEKPLTRLMAQARSYERRDGVVIEASRDIIEESWADRYLEQEQVPQ